MDPLFRLIEQGALSQWLRASSYALPGLLVLHTLGMAFAAGPAAMIDLRLLGFARRIPLAPLVRLFPLILAGLALNLVSGLLLLAAYPTKALTNPVFFTKLSLIAAAAALLPVVRRKLAAGGVEGAGLKRLAALSLLLWMAAITAGRLLAYTHTRVLVDLKVNF